MSMGLMSKAPPPIPTMKQQEFSVAMWEEIQQAQQADEMLENDETSGMLMPFDGPKAPPPHVLLERLIDAAIWADRRIEEADAIRKRIIDRKTRYQRRADRYRSQIKGLLDYLGEKSWEANEGSASMAKGVPSVIVTDIDKLEAARPELVKVEVVKTPLKLDIRPLLRDGETIEGVEMSNPEPV